MSGFQSQSAYIMPDQDLVVVRFGATNSVSSQSNDLARGVVAALTEPAPAGDAADTMAEDDGVAEEDAG